LLLIECDAGSGKPELNKVLCHVLKKNVVQLEITQTNLIY